MSNSGSDMGAGIDLAWLEERIDYRRYQECVHCGLCTASCPTYIETGDENDSPRGRIYLMRAVADRRMPMSDTVQKHLDLCLDCRACETACPSGVQYGRMVEPFKIALQRRETEGKVERPSWLMRLILHRLFPYPRRVSAALAPARLMKAVGLFGAMERVGAMRLLPPTLRHMAEMLPEKLEGRAALAEVLPAVGPKRARVALFTGCVADVMFSGTNAATARVLQRNGCEVVVPRSQVCCGAIHYHSGAEGPALELARKNLHVFLGEDVDAIIVNAAGCGAMLKDYHHILAGADHAQAERFVAKVKDVSEFLAALGPVTPEGALEVSVTYHDACHLCHAQQVRAQPRKLLEMIPGLRLLPLDETEICCGAAGTYNLTQPEMSARLGERKVERIEQTGARVVATGNVGCIMQIAKVARGKGLEIEVVHPIDLLDRAYGGAAGLEAARRRAGMAEPELAGAR